MTVDPNITKARAVAGKLRESWLRADANATTATVDRDDLDDAREALLTLSAILECVDGAALARARDAMATTAHEHTALVSAAHKLPTRYVTPAPPADKED